MKKLYPSYLNLSKKEFELRVKRSFQILEKCEVCPKTCHVNRLKGQKGFCQLGEKPTVSSYFPHFGEEAPLVGKKLRNNFFTSCNLACVFCQNYDISQLRQGKEVSFERLAEMMIELQEKGRHNINLVTLSPQVPQILKSLSLAIDKGLKIPVVCNTNGYDSVKTLKL